MPQNITDSVTYTATIVAPADGDGATAASVLTGLQGLSNRTAYLNDLATNPTTGIKALRTVASTAALTALSNPPNNQVALVPGYGVYVYVAASSATVDGLLVINGNGGAGRWLHILQTVANANPGFAVIGAGGASSGKVPASVLTNAIVSVQAASLSSTFNTSANAYTDTGLSVTVTAAPNDILIIDASGEIFNSTSAYVDLRCQVLDPAGTQIAWTYAWVATAPSQVIVSQPSQYTVVGTGSLTVKLQLKGDGGNIGFTGSAGGTSIPSSLRVIQVRP